MNSDLIKVLFIDLTHFYGGGQKFLKTVSDELAKNIEPYYVLSNDKIFNEIDSSNKVLIEKGVLNQIESINLLIKKEDIKVVFLNGNRPIYFAPFIRCMYKIAYKHTSNNALLGVKKLLGIPYLNFCYFFCDKIVLLFFEALKDILFSKDKVVIINNGIKIEKGLKKMDSVNTRIRFVCVTRLDENKGLKWLILNFYQAFSTLNDNVELIIAGDGPIMVTLKDLLAQNEIKNISLVGFVKNVDHLLTSSDVFVLPSKFESFPLSILEAMKYNLPIIATDTGGVSEMVSKENGFLIEYMDDTGMQNAMKALYNNELLRKQFGNRSREIVKEKFDLENSISKLENVVLELFEKSR